tara:strand:+ start:1472 stop:1771 length:300 start_codon:yes stop_codon:yes gene_type:complete
MDIVEVPAGETCVYCRQEFNGVEEGLAQTLEDGSIGYYHLRCVGKLCVYRIEGVLPKHLFLAVVEELRKPLPEEYKNKVTEELQKTLDDFTEEVSEEEE